MISICFSTCFTSTTYSPSRACTISQTCDFNEVLQLFLFSSLLLSSAPSRRHFRTTSSYLRRHPSALISISKFLSSVSPAASCPAVTLDQLLCSAITVMRVATWRKSKKQERTTCVNESIESLLLSFYNPPPSLLFFHLLPSSPPLSSHRHQVSLGDGVQRQLKVREERRRLLLVTFSRSSKLRAAAG